MARPRALLSVCLLGAACAASGAAREPRLDSDPRATGLAVVECRMENRSTFGTEPLRLASGSVRRFETGERWYAAAREGLLIFDGLPPGTYVLDAVRSEPGVVEARVAGRTETENRARRYRLPGTKAFAFVVEPGALVFVGPMTARNGRARGDVWVDLHEEPNAEGRAWRKVLALFPESAWAPLVRGHLDEPR